MALREGVVVGRLGWIVNTGCWVEDGEFVERVRCVLGCVEGRWGVRGWRWRVTAEAYSLERLERKKDEVTDEKCVWTENRL